MHAPSCLGVVLLLERLLICFKDVVVRFVLVQIYLSSKFVTLGVDIETEFAADGTRRLWRSKALCSSVQKIEQYCRYHSWFGSCMWKSLFMEEELAKRVL